MVVGSSDVATANGTHYWFPEVMLRLSPTSVTLQVDRCEYSGLCPLRKHPVACEQIVVSTDPEYTEFVDLNMGAPHGLSLGQAVPTAGAAPKQTLTGSPGPWISTDVVHVNATDHREYSAGDLLRHPTSDQLNAMP